MIKSYMCDVNIDVTIQAMESGFSQTRQKCQYWHQVLRSQGSIPTGGNILSLDFLFSCSKASDTNIGIFV